MEVSGKDQELVDLSAFRSIEPYVTLVTDWTFKERWGYMTAWDEWREEVDWVHQTGNGHAAKEILRPGVNDSHGIKTSNKKVLEQLCGGSTSSGRLLTVYSTTHLYRHKVLGEHHFASIT